MDRLSAQGQLPAVMLGEQQNRLLVCHQTLDMPHWSTHSQVLVLRNSSRQRHAPAVLVQERLPDLGFEEQQNLLLYYATAGNARAGPCAAVMISSGLSQGGRQRRKGAAETVEYQL